MKVKALKYILMSLFLVCGVSSLLAQVWECDFEDANERAQWVLNPLSPQAVGNGWLLEDFANLWYFGKAGNHTQNGKWGLFVSDNGVDATYSTNDGLGIVAYRELTLPAGTYNVYFDWRAQGKSLGEGLMVSWIPANKSIHSGASDFPLEMTENLINPADTLGLSRSTTWTRSSGKIKINSTGEKYKLAFYWINTSSGGSPAPPSACIDNIEIEKEGCEEPISLKTTMTKAGVKVTWKGQSDFYDVKSYDAQTDTWQEFFFVPHNAKGNQLTISNLSEGLNTIYVRSVCVIEDDTIRSNYISKDVFVFHVGTRCIDYMDLNNKTCFVDYSTGNGAGNQTLNPTQPGTVNEDYSDYLNGLHTIHYVPDEIDPNIADTDGVLYTKPKDALASVRIGRAEQSFGAKCVYTYKVPDLEKAILKLRYAVVLPNPHSDSPEQNPVFRIDIKSKNRPLEHGCGEARFISGTGDLTGWKVCTMMGYPAYWKDWTEMSINLREYVGETLTISIIITGCGMSAHGAYAYFVLDCEDGGLSGLNCGEDNPTTTFEAPDGFDYYWYYTDPETGEEKEYSREQTMTIAPMDTLTYHVDVISKTDSHCYYTLDACGIPRLPVAEGTATPTIVDCKNVVEFTNDSYLLYKLYQSDSVFTRGENVDATWWDFGDGTTSSTTSKSFTHVYPKEGGKYTARLWASISNGACEVMKEFELDLPSLDSVRVEHIYVGGSVEGILGYYYNAGVYEEKVYVDDGCTIDLLVHVHEKNFYVTDSICEGGYYVLGGDTITTAGKHTRTLKKTQLGAEHLDSIVTVDLYVEPQLQVVVSDTIAICADDNVLSIPYTVLQGKMADIKVYFGDSAVTVGFDSVYTFAPYDSIIIPLPEGIEPNYYDMTLALGTEWCPVPDIPLCAQISYPSSIIDQKDGFVALLNDEYNGGYTFATYQWYKDGEPIENATDSYISVDADDAGSEFTVTLTREGDGVVLSACPIIYGTPTDIENAWAEVVVYPTMLRPGEKLHIVGGDGFQVYNLLGAKVMEATNTTEIAAPTLAGVYFVKVNILSHSQIVKILVY